MKEEIKNRLMRFFGLVPLRTSQDQALIMYNRGVHDGYEEIKDVMDSLYGKDPAEWAKEAYRYTEERLSEMKEVVGIKDDEGQKGGLIVFYAENIKIAGNCCSKQKRLAVVRKRIQIDIACDEHDPRPMDEVEKKIFQEIDLSI